MFDSIFQVKQYSALLRKQLVSCNWTVCLETCQFVSRVCKCYRKISDRAKREGWSDIYGAFLNDRESDIKANVDYCQRCAKLTQGLTDANAKLYLIDLYSRRILPTQVKESPLLPLLFSSVPPKTANLLHSQAMSRRS